VNVVVGSWIVRVVTLLVHVGGAVHVIFTKLGVNIEKEKEAVTELVDTGETTTLISGFVPPEELRSEFVEAALHVQVIDVLNKLGLTVILAAGVRSAM
jgi:hypothetical protein